MEFSHIEQEKLTHPKILICMSGKRKSGKDHIAEMIKERIGASKVMLIRLSEPLKALYAKKHNLKLCDLMNSSLFKEIHRREMIRFGEEIRKQNPFFFCNMACQQRSMYGDMNANDKIVWIVVDCRRKSDVECLKQMFEPKGTLVFTIRISAIDDVRKARGWSFQKGVDDAESECALDDYPFTMILENSENNSDTCCSKIISDFIEVKLKELQIHESNL